MSEKENIREIILIGRGSESNFVVDDNSVSRQHAQIVDYGTYYTVVDLGSINGTFVNGRRVASETTLHAGDELKVGNVAVPWEQLVQPPQKQKKAKVLLAILIPVIAVLMIGGGAAIYFVYGRGRANTEEVNKEKSEIVKKLAQQMNKNEEELEIERQNAQKALEEQKKTLDAEKEALRVQAEEAQKKAEKAQEKVKEYQKEKEKADAEAKAKADAEAKAKSEEEQKAQEKKKHVDSEAAKEQELKNQYEKLKTSINKLKEADAWNVCYDLGMKDLPKTASAKTELLKEAAKAQNDSDRMDEIERLIKKNLK